MDFKYIYPAKNVLVEGVLGFRKKWIKTAKNGSTNPDTGTLREIYVSGSMREIYVSCVKFTVLAITTLASGISAQGFFDSCTTWWVTGEEMYADCYSESGSLVDSHESLELCISNQNGDPSEAEI
ncbi:hypothetical protein BX600DRAFT_504115 [Xylariales sp. PMI_506]|nr:hypothetical protein BX600DRAFT_504115 [Xylariales sp. PMI_506]